MNTIIGDGAGQGPEGASGTGADLVKDVDTAGFMAEVIEASRTVPVIVDFWAPWCGPCKQLGPALEKQVREAGGKVRLAKVNIDENQQLAGQLRIQSIPMVYAFFNGQPVDGFAGAVPESEVKAFIDRVVAAAGGAAGAATNPVADLIAKGKAALTAGDDGTAMQLFSQVLQQDEANVEALAGLARCYVNAGEAEAARNLISDLSEDAAGHPDIQAVKASLELAAASAGAGSVGELAAKVEANPADHQARFDLAMAHLGAGDKEGAVDALLEIVRRERNWNDGAARQQLVKMFEAWGPTDPMTVEGRQRLSTILFS